MELLSQRRVKWGMLKKNASCNERNTLFFLLKTIKRRALYALFRLVKARVSTAWTSVQAA
jgi:hypothetical protein